MDASISRSTKALLEEVSDGAVLGFSLVLIEYLRNVARMNPKPGLGSSRTALWGLQRPPIGSTTVVLCSKDTSWDSIAPLYVIFHATSARDQIELVIDPSNTDLVDICQRHKLRHTVKEIDETNDFACREDVFNVVRGNVVKPMKTYPMAGNYVSLFLPLGHIKSTKPNDEEFLLRAKLSDKWIDTLF